MVIAGLLQALVVAAVIAPRVIGVTQGPIREAAMVAKQSGGTVVAWRIIMPSFSVYRQSATPTRVPVEGELVLTRTDRQPEVQALLAPGLQMHNLYQKSFVTLARVDARGSNEGRCAARPASVVRCRPAHTCLLLALALLGVWLSNSWQGGFLAGQTASAHLPPVLWESLTTLGDELKQHQDQLGDAITLNEQL